ncbi:g2788 [Coccomyxa viridis]|uniref:G2788 protein n=1 Tax=Coccomyxa viridis TaxID=1274662 RepID=A0ABP1FL89_9CHLO
MASLLKTMLNGSGSGKDGMRRTGSFDDLSMGAGRDAEEEYSREHPEGPTSPKSPTSKFGTSPGTKSNVWQNTFNPGKNYNPNYKSVGNQYYDHVPDKIGETTVWDHVVKGERMKIFHSFDKDNDGFISAKDLELSMGRGADVKQMIAAADKNGDGKIDYGEFVEMLRNSA